MNTFSTFYPSVVNYLLIKLNLTFKIDMKDKHLIYEACKLIKNYHHKNLMPDHKFLG